MYFMMNGFRHYRYYPRFINKFMAIVDTGAFAGDHFVGFQLCFMNVIKNSLVRGNPDQMITILAICIFGCNDVFQFNSLKNRMLRPGDISE